jgi:hypothetical protein
MLTKEEILARKRGTGKAVLPDGSEVEVRALTRDEVLEAQEYRGEARSNADRDNYIIFRGMTNPKLTMDEVVAWAKEGSAGDFVAITEAIAVLSGLKKGADKSSV